MQWNPFWVALPLDDRFLQCLICLKSQLSKFLWVTTRDSWRNVVICSKGVLQNTGVSYISYWHCLSADTNRNRQHWNWIVYYCVVTACLRWDVTDEKYMKKFVLIDDVHSQVRIVGRHYDYIDLWRKAYWICRWGTKSRTNGIQMHMSCSRSKGNRN